MDTNGYEDTLKEHIAQLTEWKETPFLTERELLDMLITSQPSEKSTTLQKERDDLRNDFSIFYNHELPIADWYLNTFGPYIDSGVTDYWFGKNGVREMRKMVADLNKLKVDANQTFTKIEEESTTFKIGNCRQTLKSYRSRLRSAAILYDYIQYGGRPLSPEARKKLKLLLFSAMKNFLLENCRRAKDHLNGIDKYEYLPFLSDEYQKKVTAWKKVVDETGKVVFSPALKRKLNIDDDYIQAVDHKVKSCKIFVDLARIAMNKKLVETGQGWEEPLNTRKQTWLENLETIEEDMQQCEASRKDLAMIARDIQKRSSQYSDMFPDDDGLKSNLDLYATLTAYFDARLLKIIKKHESFYDAYRKTQKDFKLTDVVKKEKLKRDVDDFIHECEYDKYIIDEVSRNVRTMFNDAKMLKVYSAQRLQLIDAILRDARYDVDTE